MDRGTKIRTGAAAVMMCAAILAVAGQNPAGINTATQPSGAQGRAPSALPVPAIAYPKRPAADPAALERGQVLYRANCSFCHGSTAKGGEGGPNLVRSRIVMDDRHGETIATVVQNGLPGRGMPKFDLTPQQISDIADFIHSFPVGSHASRGVLINPVVGNAQAGEAYFTGAGNCSACHSPTGDLAGIGSKYEPMLLQRALLTGGIQRGGQPAIQVTVTLPSGEIFEGKLQRIDDFIVSLVDSDGDVRTFRRAGNVPKVDLKNPLQAHVDMWRTMTDDTLHNLTAYLVTLK